MSTVSHPVAGPGVSAPLALVVVASLLLAALSVAGSAPAASAAESPAVPDHVVVSELITGGASASDEFIELYNPTGAALPLEGLELVYVSASGLTVSRRAAWEVGAPELSAGHHLLIANEAGIYAGIADATYASGMAATGGSVALRIIGAGSAVDAVGWGSAAGSWLEGIPAPAPDAGESLERRPGGPSGSTQDTDDNATDFVVRPVPSPENASSPAVPSPSSTGSPLPSPTATPVATASPSAPPSASPSPDPTTIPGPTVVSIATARAQADGTLATIEGVALSGSGFTDGGGYLADASGSLAVLLTDATFERGELLRVTGELDDRYAQRTLRAVASGLVRLGSSPEPAPVAVGSGAVGEAVEGLLVRIAGTIAGTPTSLSSGLAFDVDDGSGPVRVLVATATGIDTGPWLPGATIDVVGVVGQRDAGGTGSAGYRVQPRDGADVRSVGAPPAASPSVGPSSSAGPSPSDAPGTDVSSIAEARRLSKNARATVRGVVTLVPGIVHPTTVVIQDGTGAIVLRAGEEVGPFVRGTLVEVEGVRSTLGGMETLRVVTPPRSLGAATEPAARTLATGAAGEAHEATLVTVRGGLVGAPRRSTAGTVSFEIDDGSGPLRISIGSATGIDVAALSAGTWIEVRGPLGQETSGSQPLRGYRVWPRDAADLRITAPATSPGGATGTTTTPGTAQADGSVSPASLEGVGSAVNPGLPVGATLVTGPWEELGIGGLLWDGTRLMALDSRLGGAVGAVVRGATVPLAVEIVGLRTIGVESETGIAVADFRADPGSILATQGPPVPPATVLPTASSGARWVTLLGRLTADGSRIVADGASIPIEHRCAADADHPRGVVSITGIAIARPLGLIAPCGAVTRAPALSRVAVAPVAPTTASAVEANPAVVHDDSEGHRGPAALLLVAAATTLVAGAIALRRRSSDPDPEDVVDASVADEPDAELPEPGSLPTLTLVAVPRERAP